MYVTYALEDPRNNEVFYVGMTVNLYIRFMHHIRCQDNNKAKNARVMELQSLGLLPIPRTLETSFTEQDARKGEAYWITHYMRLGMPLTNFECMEAKQERKIKSTQVNEDKTFTSVQELEFIRLYLDQRSIKKSLTQMHLGYGRYQRCASRVVQERQLRRA